MTLAIIAFCVGFMLALIIAAPKLPEPPNDDELIYLKAGWDDALGFIVIEQPATRR
jgi:hypothetical protein